nr:Chain B, AGGRETIN BETA CHAIN [Calloselasma rhodostoma]
DCPSGWSSYEGHCYKPFNEPKNWADAERFCKLQPKHSHLVSFQSAEEADFVVKLTRPRLKANLVWMGLSNIWHGCNWQWSDGARLNYKDWQEQSECLAFRGVHTEWLNMDCSSTCSFVCKFKA